jgi:hypothetical protein
MNLTHRISTIRECDQQSAELIFHALYLLTEIIEIRLFSVLSNMEIPVNGYIRNIQRIGGHFYLNSSIVKINNTKVLDKRNPSVRDGEILYLLKSGLSAIDCLD